MKAKELLRYRRRTCVTLIEQHDNAKLRKRRFFASAGAHGGRLVAAGFDFFFQAFWQHRNIGRLVMRNVPWLCSSPVVVVEFATLPSIILHLEQAQTARGKELPDAFFLFLNREGLDGT